MKAELIFPTIQMLWCFAAAITYGARGNIKWALYWALAGTITAVVTYMKG